MKYYLIFIIFPFSKRKGCCSRGRLHYRQNLWSWRQHCNICTWSLLAQFHLWYSTMVMMTMISAVMIWSKKCSVMAFFQLFNGGNGEPFFWPLSVQHDYWRLSAAIGNHNKSQAGCHREQCQLLATLCNHNWLFSSNPKLTLEFSNCQINIGPQIYVSYLLISEKEWENSGALRRRWRTLCGTRRRLRRSPEGSKILRSTRWNYLLTHQARVI